MCRFEINAIRRVFIFLFVISFGVLQGSATAAPSHGEDGGYGGKGALTTGCTPDALEKWLVQLFPKGTNADHRANLMKALRQGAVEKTPGAALKKIQDFVTRYSEPVEREGDLDFISSLFLDGQNGVTGARRAVVIDSVNRTVLKTPADDKAAKLLPLPKNFEEFKKAIPGAAHLHRWGAATDEFAKEVFGMITAADKDAQDKASTLVSIAATKQNIPLSVARLWVGRFALPPALAKQAITNFDYFSNLSATEAIAKQIVDRVKDQAKLVAPKLEDPAKWDLAKELATDEGKAFLAKIVALQQNVPTDPDPAFTKLAKEVDGYARKHGFAFTLPVIIFPTLANTVTPVCLFNGDHRHTAEYLYAKATNPANKAALIASGKSGVPFNETTASNHELHHIIGELGRGDLTPKELSQVGYAWLKALQAIQPSTRPGDAVAVLEHLPGFTMTEARRLALLTAISSDDPGPGPSFKKVNPLDRGTIVTALKELAQKKIESDKLTEKVDEIYKTARAAGMSSMEIAALKGQIITNVTDAGYNQDDRRVVRMAVAVQELGTAERGNGIPNLEKSLTALTGKDEVTGDWRKQAAALVKHAVSGDSAAINEATLKGLVANGYFSLSQAPLVSLLIDELALRRLTPPTAKSSPADVKEYVETARAFLTKVRPNPELLKKLLSGEVTGLNPAGLAALNLIADANGIGLVKEKQYDAGNALFALSHNTGIDFRPLNPVTRAALQDRVTTAMVSSGLGKVAENPTLLKNMSGLIAPVVREHNEEDFESAAKELFRVAREKGIDTDSLKKFITGNSHLNFGITPESPRGRFLQTQVTPPTPTPTVTPTVTETPKWSPTPTITPTTAVPLPPGLKGTVAKLLDPTNPNNCTTCHNATSGPYSATKQRAFEGKTLGGKFADLQKRLLAKGATDLGILKRMHDNIYNSSPIDKVPAKDREAEQKRRDAERRDLLQFLVEFKGAPDHESTAPTPTPTIGTAPPAEKLDPVVMAGILTKCQTCHNPTGSAKDHLFTGTGWRAQLNSLKTMLSEGAKKDPTLFTRMVQKNAKLDDVQTKALMKFMIGAQIGDGPVPPTPTPTVVVPARTDEAKILELVVSGNTVKGVNYKDPVGATLPANRIVLRIPPEDDRVKFGLKTGDKIYYITDSSGNPKTALLQNKSVSATQVGLSNGWSFAFYRSGGEPRWYVTSTVGPREPTSSTTMQPGVQYVRLNDGQIVPRPSNYYWYPPQPAYPSGYYPLGTPVN